VIFFLDASNSELLSKSNQKLMAILRIRKALNSWPLIDWNPQMEAAVILKAI
jgi:hypothetical protein